VQAAMVVTWRGGVPGRERQGVAYGLEVTTFWNEQASKGVCSAPEMFFSSDGDNLWMVKGDSVRLLTVWLSDESLRLMTKGQLLLQGFGWRFMMTGTAAEQHLARVADTAAHLA